MAFAFAIALITTNSTVSFTDNNLGLSLDNLVAIEDAEAESGSGTTCYHNPYPSHSFMVINCSSCRHEHAVGGYQSTCN